MAVVTLRVALRGDPAAAILELGISTGHAGRLLLTAGQNIQRFHHKRAFARAHSIRN